MATKESLTPGYPWCQRLFMRGSRFRFFSRFAARDFGSRPKICRPATDTEAISPQTRKKPLVSRLDTAALCTEFKCQPSRGTESLPPAFSRHGILCTHEIKQVFRTIIFLKS